MSIRIGIMGYGNLGRGVECAILQNPDMELTAVFTRRDPAAVQLKTAGVKVYPAEMAAKMQDQLDVLILCGGSATDLPVQTPEYARMFNVIDSFDTHARIPEHFEQVDRAAKEGGKTAIISVGWDPGMFSLNRVYADAILPEGSTYTFWGKGVSQGHSDAIRRIEGVVDARQYTVPVESALEAVRAGQNPELTTREKHTRECYVVAAEGADKARIEKEIKTMPNYFDEYDTTVHFIGLEELKRDHSELPHGGFVIRSGQTGMEKEHHHVVEYSLKLDSNPEFTSSILVAYARAAYRLSQEGAHGCKTVLDVPPAYLSSKDGAQLRKSLCNRMRKIIEYKKIRGVYMRVDPTNQVIRISAPYGFPSEEIDRMVAQKKEWIDRQLAKASVRTLPENAEDILRERLQRLIPLYEKRMGLHAASYTIRDMKTRWGSCTPKTGRIRLNLQLAGYPEACLEYVLVHELAHLRIPNHSPAFWKLVEEYVPNWKEIRRQLRG